MSQERNLNVAVDNATIFKILAVGREFDLEKNGLYDARMGCVNVWCSPEDKPNCWDSPIIPAALKYPRSFVGTLYWEWNEECNEAKLSMSAEAYELKDKKKRERGEVDWDNIFDWLQEKIWFLVRMAKIHPKAVGHKCPICDFVLPIDRLINELLVHMEEHGTVEGLVLRGAEKTLVLLNGQSYPLEVVEEF